MNVRSPYTTESRTLFTDHRTNYRIGASYELRSEIFFVRDAPIEPENTLYYGDNLDILRTQIKDDSVDLIYLDPPFNSNATYNVLFKSPKGEQSPAQIEAFEDTWHWNEHAARAFDEVMTSGNTEVAELLRAMHSVLKTNDMMAYLTMMAVRCLELHRVLKPTGSFYLHCDPTASHYLKLLLDAIFGKNNFRREIIWSLETVSGFKSQANNWVRGHDTILFYTKSDDYYFKKEFLPHKEEYLKRFKKVDAQGRRYRDDRSGGRVQYLDDTQGRMLSDVWSDIMSFQQASTSKELLGYPTQKPLALLERIINASSKEGDMVLDPFCGCGTAIHAAQRLGRHWIGIDITHLAISLIEKRLRDAFPGINFVVHGVPKDMESAEALAKQDKYQFQWWAVSLVNAVPFGGKKKGADGGIDGYIYFKPDGKKTEAAIVSVKGGENVSVAMIRELAHVVDSQQAKMGIFITLAEPTGPMKTEAVEAGFYKPPYHEKVPKIQIFNIQELFDGKRPQIPFVDPSAFRKAETEGDGMEQPALL